MPQHSRMIEQQLFFPPLWLPSTSLQAFSTSSGTLWIKQPSPALQTKQTYTFFWRTERLSSPHSCKTKYVNSKHQFTAFYHPNSCFSNNCKPVSPDTLKHPQECLTRNPVIILLNIYFVPVQIFLKKSLHR